MARTNFRTVTLSMLAFTLFGCSAQPPKCSDEKTLFLVKEIVFEHFKDAVELSKEEIIASLNFTFPRATAHEDKIRKYSCEAKLVISDKYEVPISYESQLDDGDQHLVSVGSISQAGLNAIHLGFLFAREKATSNTAHTDSTIATQSESQTTNSPSAQQELSLNLPDIKTTEPYSNVREKMLSADWQPFHTEDADECGEGDTRCQNRPEMASCAGTGLANCRFLWKKGEETIGICTIGEGEPTFSNYC